MSKDVRCENCDQLLYMCTCTDLFGNTRRMQKEKPKNKKLSKKQLITSLNFIDSFACESDAVLNNDCGEAQKLEKHYNRLFDYLNSL